MWKSLKRRDSRIIGIAIALLGYLTLGLILSRSGDQTCTKPAEQSVTATRAAALHVPFLDNRGQYPRDVHFYARTFAGMVFVTDNGELVYSMPRHRNGSSSSPGWFSFNESFPGRKPGIVRGVEKSSTRINIFKGSDPSGRPSNIPAYEELNCGEICPGVGMTMRSSAANVEKIFSVASGFDPSSIRIRISGADGLQVNESGELEVVSEAGTISFTRPVAYQDRDGEREYVDVAYALRGENEYGFDVPVYDPSRSLIIDPLLASTYLGGSGQEGGANLYGIRLATGPDGSVYVAGMTTSPDFPPLPGIYDDSYNGSEDLFIAHLDASLSTLLAVTYLGGSADEEHPDLLVDELGKVYLAGTTRSSDFPWTHDAYDSTYFDSADVFISVLNTDLSELLASTYLGGRGTEQRVALALDGDGDIIVAGTTSGGIGFPTTPGAYDPTYNGGETDFFVASLSSDLTTLIASTFIGGSDLELVPTLQISDAGHVYMAGTTASPDYPATIGAYDADFNGPPFDGSIAKLDNDLGALLAATFIGGSDFDGTGNLQLDASSKVYVISHTMSPDYPTTTDVYDRGHSGEEEYAVSRFDSDLATLLTSTFITPADSGLRYCWKMHVTGDGTVYFGGLTAYTDLPTTPCTFDDSYNGGLWDGFVSILDSDFKRMLYSTYLGGNNRESVRGIEHDEMGNFFIMGVTLSADFPVTDGAYAQTYQGGATDAFVMKFDFEMDCDSDGVLNINDNCPMTSNPGQDDTDADGVGEVCDNCPEVYNPAQEDLDGDGIGDSCEFNQTWRVYADGSGTTPSIQVAIDSSYHGDTIIVADGLYTGDGNRDLDLRGRRGLQINSENGPDVTVIECGGTSTEPHRGITIDGDVDSTCVIDGLTIRGGYGPMTDGSPTGGAMLIVGSSPVIRNCVFVNNSAVVGGGLFARESSARFINCTFAGNAANYGAALCVFNNSALSLENCILAFNEQGALAYCFESSTVNVECSDVYGNTGGDYVGCLAGQQASNGNFSVDPMFCNLTAGDCAPADEASPCLPDNNDCATLIGALDMGCSCDCGLWGDADGNVEINPVDVVHMVNFVYKNQDARVQSYNCPYEAGDVNCDEAVNPVDVVYYVNYVYKNLKPWPCTDPCP